MLTKMIGVHWGQACQFFELVPDTTEAETGLHWVQRDILLQYTTTVQADKVQHDPTLRPTYGCLQRQHTVDCAYIRKK